MPASVTWPSPGAPCGLAGFPTPLGGDLVAGLDEVPLPIDHWPADEASLDDLASFFGDDAFAV